ncbi:hypothetical protein K1T71_000490 [Dendrolimus kikuchii]|uniref:Uncharacterized protein n=1 Tax=Dendrolimus kikuchii TaxID=765133 RepID=A0ACC1DJI1_9NEOP|nr:hypothetical protein K1T71_000490 [Dendrolimus kikuchii]
MNETYDIFDTSEFDYEGDFDEQITNLLSYVRLSKQEVENLTLLFGDLDVSLQTVWPGCQVLPFGSIITGMGIKTSDVDCYIELPNFVERKQSIVMRAKDILRRYPHIFQNLFAVASAKCFFLWDETDEDIISYSSTVGDYTPFYVAIAISSALLGSIILLNIVCCFSRFRDYWLDTRTGNRLIGSIWTETPHKQPALDLSELKVNITQIQYMHAPTKKYFDNEPIHSESEIAPSISRQPLTDSEEYLELHRRESDI